MAQPKIELLAPSEITERLANLNGILLDHAGKQVHVVFNYRRSGKPHWNGRSAGWFSSSPHNVSVRIETKWPNLQHECRLAAHWYAPEPGGSVFSDIMRFWFIPYSLRAKGAPFLVTSFNISVEDKTITLKVETDIPVRLKARISTIAPFTTAEVETKRGRAFRHHPILVWQWQWEISQQERGDTLSHTFVWEAPKYCRIYYFQCWGTTDGRTSPSRSPFFKAHPPVKDFWLFMLEEWTISAEPPEWELILMEPWELYTKPPTFAILIEELWTS